MAIIGNRRHAAFAYGMAREHFDPTNGWCRTSGGCRKVYIHEPSGVVYKVDHEQTHPEHYRWGYDNAAELTHARRLAAKCKANDYWWGAYVRIPKVSGFTINGEIVIAMQYIAEAPIVDKWTKPAISREAANELLSLGMGDMHGNNFIVDVDGVIWPIDLGSPVSKRSRGGHYFDRPDTRMMARVRD